MTKPDHRQIAKRRQTQMHRMPSEPLRVPHWLELWTADQRVPASADEVNSIVMAFEAAILESTPEMVARALAPLVSYFSRTLPPDWHVGADKTKPGPTAFLYVDRLRDIPPDLLTAAVDRVIDTSEFFPTIARIRNAVESELRSRNDVLRRLKAAALFARLQQKSRAA